MKNYDSEGIKFWEEKNKFILKRNFSFIIIKDIKNLKKIHKISPIKHKWPKEHKKLESPENMARDMVHR